MQGWFTEHPLYDADGQPIVVPAWSFPGRGRVQRQLTRASKAMGLAEKGPGPCPSVAAGRSWMAGLEERHLLADRALGYVELYGAYAETEARYRVDRLLALWDGWTTTIDQAFCLDPAAVDWDVYVPRRAPPVGHRARPGPHRPTRSTPGRRAERARGPILSPDRHLAAFDLENTLIASNVVDSYAWLASRHLPATERAAFVADLVREAPSLLALDRRDRGDFLRSFYRRYEGAPADRLREDAWELFHHLLLAKSFPAGLARVRQHRALGHRTLLITGALDFVVEPLRPLFDDIVCARLGEADGRFTGRLDELPPIGEARALVLADYREAEGLRLEESMAYADSASDLPMLEAVGYPVAVNPEAKLAAIARRRGWHVEHWHKADGALGAAPPPRAGGPPEGPAGGRPGRGRRRPAAEPRSGDGPMKALVLERNLPRFAASRVASLLGSGRGAGVGPLELARRDPPEPPGEGLGPPPAPALGHLRLGPGHPRRAQLPLLRGHGQLPLRARARGGRSRSTAVAPTTRAGRSSPAPGW